MTTTTEVAVIEDDEVGETMTKKEAQALNRKIKTLSEKVSTNAFELLTLIEQASTGNIHKALEYKSWTEWYAENVQIEVSDKDERKMLVNMMSGKGMSQRAIGASLGIGQATVSRDLDGDSSESGATTGLDGKTYKREPEVIDGEVVDVVEESAEEAAEAAEDKPARWSAKNVDVAVENLVDAVNVLLDLSELPQFGKAKAKLFDSHHEDLEAVRDGVQDVLDKLFS